MKSYKVQKSNYDTWYRDGPAVLRDHKIKHHRYCCHILDKLGAHPGQKLLDIACGRGDFLEIAKAQGIQSYGLDISSVALEMAPPQCIGSMMVSLGENLPFPDNTFDYITCLGSLEHFLEPEIAIREMRRVLKEDGWAFIHVPNLFFLGHIYMAIRYGVPPSEGDQQFSEQFNTFGGWRRFIEDNELQVVEYSKYNNIWATKKVSPATIFLWNLVKHLIPMGLSYSFDYICRKK